MYQRTNASTHFMARGGSYSTHGARNGRVIVYPPGARPEEMLSQEAAEQYRVAVKEMQSAQERLAGPCTPEDRDALRDRVRALAKDLKALRKIVKPQFNNHQTIFYFVAKTLLSPELFRELQDATEQEIARISSLLTLNHEMADARRARKSTK